MFGLLSYVILYVVSFSMGNSYAAEAQSPYAAELLADKAAHPSLLREYSKSHPIDPTIQKKLSNLTQKVAAAMGVSDVSMCIAESNSLNNKLSNDWDFTNTQYAYSIDFFGFFKSITLGEDIVTGCSENQIQKFIAHELAHIKSQDFTKRFLAVVGIIAATYYFLHDQNITDTAIRSLALLPTGALLGLLFYQQEQAADAVALEYIESKKSK